MKTWEEFNDHRHTGEWHVHTYLTDGEASIEQYCERAMRLGIPLIAFTEHVRRRLSYDFSDFLDQIDKARDEFDLIILSGCEAKVLPGGALDVPDEILEQVDYPVFSFHSFPADDDIYIESLINVLKENRVETWAHPTANASPSLLLRLEQEIDGILSLMSKNGIALEINKKHSVPSNDWVRLAGQRSVRTVRGSDVHRLEDLSNYRSVPL